MIRALDGWLLDRIQWIADRIHDHTRIDSVRQMQAWGVVCLVIDAVQFCEGRSIVVGVWMVIFSAYIVGDLLWGYVGKNARAAASQGLRNANRLIFFSLRILLVGNTCFMLAMDGPLHTSPSYPEIGMACFCCYYYWQAVDVRPPRPKRVRVGLDAVAWHEH